MVASLNQSLDVYLVVGIGTSGRASTGVVRDRFGLAFHDIAQENRARIRMDMFETSVVEVRKSDLAAFLEGLSLRAV